MLLNPFRTQRSNIQVPQVTHAIFIVLFVCTMLVNLNFPLAPSLLLAKGGLILGTALAGLIHAIVTRRSGLTKTAVALHIATICFALVAGLVGVLNNTPGAVNQIMYYVMWPTLYFFMLLGLRGTTDLKRIQSLLYGSGAFFGVYGVLFVLTQLGYIPQTPIYSFLSQFSRSGENAAQHAGYVEIDFAPLSSAPFLVPFVLSLFMLSNYRKISGWVVAGLVVVVTLLSGRRALWVDVAIAPVIVLGLAVAMRAFRAKVWQPRHLFGMMMTVIIFLFTPSLLIDALGLDSAALRQYAQSVTQETDQSTSGGIRRFQSKILIEDWSDHPVLGSGLGAVSRVIRNPDVPWSYESTFQALLFQGGLVATLAFLAFVVFLCGWVFLTALRHAQFRVFGVSLLTGLICYLVAALTNPYLMRIDGLWVFLFPLAYCNILALQRAVDPAPAPIPALKRKSLAPPRFTWNGKHAPRIILRSSRRHT